ncbi:MAG: hypothetical protein K6T83_14905 [Alicyclobacillus sp.]|nr:hypothetical protein [Alicyclobacillus sp.]
MTNVIAQYKAGKSVYQITPEGFVDNINPALPGMAMVYPWADIYASLEYENARNPRTSQVEPVLRWMRVYTRDGQRIADLYITDAIRSSMVRFFEVFEETQKQALGRPSKTGQ